MKAIVVLNDGETWADVNECCVMIVTDADFQLLNDTGEYPKWIEPVVRLTILNDTPEFTFGENMNPGGTE